MSINKYINFIIVIYIMILHIKTLLLEKKIASNVCFGAKDNNYGSFILSETLNPYYYKLVYKSGYVACYNGD